MGFDIKYDSEQECITVTFTGRVSTPIVRKYLDALLPLLEETGCTRLLSDCREAETRFTSSDIMQFPKIAEETPLTAQLKRAVVAIPGTSGFELYEILSKVMGQQLRLFESMEEAQAWLFAEPEQASQTELGT
jgi:hypothetical protein